MGSSSADRSWGNYYWLRSADPSNADRACLATNVGGLYGYYVDYSNRTARAAFKFSVDEG